MEFNKLWYKEYLLELGRKIPGQSRLRTRNRLSTDDVVLIKSPLKPRPFWVLGTITELIPDNDGVVRAARVQRGDGGEEVNSLKHLYHLELSRVLDGPPVVAEGRCLRVHRLVVSPMQPSAAKSEHGRLWFVRQMVPFLMCWYRLATSQKTKVVLAGLCSSKKKKRRERPSLLPA